MGYISTIQARAQDSVGTCPCKGCTKETGRGPSCHSKCNRYIIWKDEYEKVRVKYATEERITRDTVCLSDKLLLGKSRRRK